MSDAVGIHDLSLLHCEAYDEGKWAPHTYRKDLGASLQSTATHKKFYANFDLIRPTYLRFIHQEIAPIFGEEILYQRTPTFRIQVPESVSVSEYHRDRDYMHQTEELNFFLPVTNAWGSNTIWCESIEGLKDYSPIEADYGEVVCFDGANLMHGNRRNDTDYTRISMDFRVIPAGLFQDDGRMSLTSKTRFAIGDYWEECHE